MIIGASSHLDVKQNMCFSFQTILHLYMPPLCLNLQVEQLIQYKNLNITLMIVIRVIVLDDLVSLHFDTGLIRSDGSDSSLCSVYWHTELLVPEQTCLASISSLC